MSLKGCATVSGKSKATQLSYLLYYRRSFFFFLPLFKFLINEPSQFLRHYYHFVAEVLLGAWAFWTGTFTPPTGTPSPPDPLTAIPPSYLKELNSTPPVHRLIFTNSDADGWRDNPGFDAYFLRAAFPSLSVEHIDDWEDRVHATTTQHSYDFNNQQQQLLSENDERAWLMPVVLLSDRSAANRGKICQNTHRSASEAVELMRGNGRLEKGWWEPVRKAVSSFAGAEDLKMKTTDNMPDKIVITYLSRQGTRRRLIQGDHDLLVQSLRDLVQRKNGEGGVPWEVNVVEAEGLSKDQQVRLMVQTSVSFCYLICSFLTC
jgi:hypothetical protein